MSNVSFGPKVVHIKFTCVKIFDVTKFSWSGPTAKIYHWEKSGEIHKVPRLTPYFTTLLVLSKGEILSF